MALKFYSCNIKTIFTLFVFHINLKLIRCNRVVENLTKVTTYNKMSDHFTFKLHIVVAVSENIRLIAHFKKTAFLQTFSNNSSRKGRKLY